MPCASQSIPSSFLLSSSKTPIKVLPIIFILLSQAYISSQSSLKLEFGSGNSSISDFSILFDDGRYKGKIKINKARSAIRNIDFDLLSEDEFCAILSLNEHRDDPEKVV